MTAPTPSLAADRTLAEPYTTRSGKLVKEQCWTFRLAEQLEGPDAKGPTVKHLVDMSEADCLFECFFYCFCSLSLSLSLSSKD